VARIYEIIKVELPYKTEDNSIIPSNKVLVSEFQRKVYANIPQNTQKLGLGLGLGLEPKQQKFPNVKRRPKQFFYKKLNMY